MNSAVTARPDDPLVHGPKVRYRDSHRLIDIACWALAIFGVYLIHYDFVLTPLQVVMVLGLIVITGCAQWLFGWGFLGQPAR